MSKIIKGLKVAANVAEIIVAGSVIIELAGKYGGKIKAKLFGTKSGPIERTN